MSLSEQMRRKSAKQRAMVESAVRTRLAALNAMPRQDRMAALVEEGMEKKAALAMVTGKGADAALHNYVFEKAKEEHEAKQKVASEAVVDAQPPPTEFSHITANAEAKEAADPSCAHPASPHVFPRT